MLTQERLSDRHPDHRHSDQCQLFSTPPQAETAPLPTVYSLWKQTLWTGTAVALSAMAVAIGSAGLVRYGQHLQHQHWITTLEATNEQGDYATCIEKSYQFPHAPAELVSQAENWRYTCKVNQAIAILDEADQQFATQNFAEAIATVRQISVQTPDQHTTAQQRIENWSAQIFAAAQQQYEQGAWATAIQWAEIIPESSSHYAEVRQAIAQWETES